MQTTIITLYQESNSSFDKGFSIFSVSWLCENDKNTIQPEMEKRQAKNMRGTCLFWPLYLDGANRQFLRNTQEQDRMTGS
ncbi:hypothetical protein ACI0YT_000056 [Cronobacter dublinensis]